LLDTGKLCQEFFALGKTPSLKNYGDDSVTSHDSDHLNQNLEKPMMQKCYIERKNYYGEYTGAGKIVL